MKRDVCRKNEPNGFTLIELVVVMLLISIILSVALPRFSTGIARDPSKKVARWMIHTVRTLRTQAIQKQTVQTLMIDLSSSRMWVTSQSMDEEALAEAAENAFRLPGGIEIVDVEYAGKDMVSSGTAEISFYPAGYADKVAIRMQDGSAKRFTYLLEPLLPKVKLLEEWVSF